MKTKLSYLKTSSASYLDKRKSCHLRGNEINRFYSNFKCRI